MSRSRLLPLLLVGVFWVASPVHAIQQAPDSIRAAALRDFHGPDLEGKDGILAKAGLDLLILYHEYQAFKRSGGDSFTPDVTDAKVSNGHVTIDAIARDSAGQLRNDLKAIGFKDANVAGRVVSGVLPIDHIPALARLESLRGVILPKMRTHDRAPAPPPPPGNAPAPSQKPADSPGGNQSDPAPRPEPRAPGPAEDDPNCMGIILLVFAGIVVVVES